MYNRPGRKGAHLDVDTMHVYLAAVRSLHIMHGLPPPPTSAPRVLLALKSVASVSLPPSQKLPISFPLLISMLQVLPNNSDARMWSALLTLAYAGALRGSEYTAVFEFNSSNLIIPPPMLQAISFGTSGVTQYMVYTVIQSKTNIHPFNKYIACVGSAYCPVCLMRSYLKHRQIIVGCTPNHPLFVYSNGLAVDKQGTDQMIKYLVSQLGLNPEKYTTHSLRAGAISAGHVAGLSEKDLASIGNHKSDAYKRYIRFDLSHALNISKQLLQ